MKVKITVDSELVPIIVRALTEYTKQSITNLVDAATPTTETTSKKPAPKKRGRPRGSTSRKASVATVAVGSVSATV